MRLRVLAPGLQYSTATELYGRWIRVKDFLNGNLSAACCRKRVPVGFATATPITKRAKLKKM